MQLHQLEPYLSPDFEASALGDSTSAGKRSLGASDMLYSVVKGWPLLSSQSWNFKSNDFSEKTEIYTTGVQLKSVC